MSRPVCLLGIVGGDESQWEHYALIPVTPGNVSMMQAYARTAASLMESAARERLAPPQILYWPNPLTVSFHDADDMENLDDMDVDRVRDVNGGSRQDFIFLDDAGTLGQGTEMGPIDSTSYEIEMTDPGRFALRGELYDDHSNLPFNPQAQVPVVAFERALARAVMETKGQVVGGVVEDIARVTFDGEPFMALMVSCDDGATRFLAIDPRNEIVAHATQVGNRIRGAGDEVRIAGTDTPETAGPTA
jgi:hypothetical protein